MLNECDYIVCEEYREAGKLLKFFEIEKELFALNEHNEESASDEIFNDLIAGKNISLISDCGTPVFSDPGYELLTRCIHAKISIEFIGGANSIMAALVLCGFDVSRFSYHGFLSPKSELRLKQIEQLSSSDETIVLMDAPYRLKALLKDIGTVFPERKIFAGVDITMNSEKQFRGTASEILDEIGEEILKGEFIIIINKNDKHN